MVFEWSSPFYLAESRIKCGAKEGVYLHLIDSNNRERIVNVGQSGNLAERLDRYYRKYTHQIHKGEKPDWTTIDLAGITGDIYDLFCAENLKESFGRGLLIPGDFRVSSEKEAAKLNGLRSMMAKQLRVRVIEVKGGKRCREIVESAIQKYLVMKFGMGFYSMRAGNGQTYLNALIGKIEHKAKTNIDLTFNVEVADLPLHIQDTVVTSPLCWCQC